ESKMIRNKEAEFQVLWDSLTLNQRKTLKLVLLQAGKGLFTSKSLAAMELKTPSVVTRCLTTLCDNEILVKSGKIYTVQDLLLKKWVEQKM
ncbi:MAG: hypothetical protein MI802_08475, partial [Desulfobacterales bacterium]|nr:hypothetical protein [Desulfobacterales bacterium]